MIIRSIAYTFLLMILFQGKIFSQSSFPSIVNVAGKTSSSADLFLEWSVGESAAITTMTNDNLLVTNGLLQFSVENQTEINNLSYFLPNEVRVYPNPVENILNINILHADKGIHQLELLNELGAKVKEVKLIYHGIGALQKWNLSGLPAGQYFLNIRQTHPVTGRLIKKGAYKILKIK